LRIFFVFSVFKDFLWGASILDKGQILTPEELPAGLHYDHITGTKVQILTPEELAGLRDAARVHALFTSPESGINTKKPRKKQSERIFVCCL